LLVFATAPQKQLLAPTLSPPRIPLSPRAVPEVLEPAQLELVDTALWYDERRDGYGDLFLREVAGLFDLIDRMPLAGPPWLLAGIPEGVRHVALRTFPVSIVYVTDPRLVVVAFLGAQDPTHWIDRLDQLHPPGTRRLTRR
jgi:hypothetical protein